MFDINFKYIFDKIKNFPIFSNSHISGLIKDEQVLRNQLNLRQKQGLVLKLKRGLYILNEDDRKISREAAKEQLNKNIKICFRL